MKKILAALLALACAGANALDMREGANGYSCQYFDAGTTTSWANQGGDWKDRLLVDQGNDPFKTATLADVDQVRGISFDVTSMVTTWGSDSSFYRGFYLKNMGSNSAAYSTKEGAYPPRLRVLYANHENINYYPTADGQIACPGNANDSLKTSMVLNPNTGIVLSFHTLPRRGDVVSATLLLTSFAQYGATEVGLFQLVEPNSGEGPGGGGGDVTAPVLSSTNPVDNSSSVSIGSNISLTFNETVQAGTGLISLINGGTGTLVESFNTATGTGSGGGTVTFGTNTVTVDPLALLSYDTPYYVTIASGAIRDGSGNAYAGFSDSTTLNFRTVVAPDTTAPTLSSSTPADNATSIATNTNILLVFSEAIEAGAGTITIKRTSDDATIETFTPATTAGSAGGTVTVGSFSVTLDPFAALANSTEYYVLVDGTAIKDLAGNHYAGISSTTALSFTTAAAADATAPTLSSSTPADDATGVAYDSDVTLTFSEDVLAGSDSITLKKTSDNSTVESFNVVTGAGTAGGTVGISGDTVTINPGADFGIGVGYYINVPSTAIKDAAGNFYAGIADATTLNFTALADTTNPTLSSSNPADEAADVAINSNVSLIFSENVAAGTGNITLKRTSDDATIETFDVAAGTGSAGGTVAFSLNQVTLNPFADLANSTGYYVLVDATAVDDVYGNSYAGISLKTTLNFTTAAAADSTAPTLASSVPSDGATGVSISADMSLTFSESVLPGTGSIYLKRTDTDATVESFNVETGAGSATGTVSFSTDTVTINPFANLGSQIGYYLTVDATAVKDNAGNAYAGISDKTVLNFTSADSTPPTVSIATSDSALAIGDTDPTITFTFSEDIDDLTFTDSDITVESGTKGTLTKASETSYTMSYTPAASTEDTSMVISIASGAFSDLAGNASTVASQLPLWVDNVRPSVVMLAADEQLAAGDTTSVTFSFSEPLADVTGFPGWGFLIGGVAVESGTKSNFQKVSETLYSMTYTPAENTVDASMVFSIGASTYRDLIGNGNVTPDTYSIAVDTSTGTSITEAADWQRMYDGALYKAPYTDPYKPTGVNKEFWNGDIKWRWKNWKRNLSVTDTITNQTSAGQGDWSDCNGTPWGTTTTCAGFSIPTQQFTAGGETFTINVKPLVDRWVSDPKKYKGFMLRRTAGTGSVTLASREHTTVSNPLLTINYTDGTSTSVEPDADSTIDPGTYSALGKNTTLVVDGTRNTALSFWVPGGVPRKAVSSATLRLTSTAGSTMTLGVFQLEQPDPGLDQPVWTTTVTCPGGTTASRAGIAACYTNDVNIGAHPDVYFVERFDSSTWYSATSGGAARWQDRAAHESSVVTSESGFSGLTGSGDQAHKITWSTGQTGDAGEYGTSIRTERNASWLNNPPAGLTELYFRWYIRPMTNFNGCLAGSDSQCLEDGGKMPGFTWNGQGQGTCGNGNNSCISTGGWSARGGFYSVTDPNNPARQRLTLDSYMYTKDLHQVHVPWDDWSTASVPLGAWTCVEQRVRLNSGSNNDGVMEAWINGKKVYSRSNFKFNNTDFPNSLYPADTVWVDHYLGGTRDATKFFGMYQDNLVIAKSYIGCIPGTY